MSEITDISDAWLNDQRQAKASATAALDDNPDDAARAQQLALETGVPASVIHGDLEGFERQHKAQLNSQLISQNPILQDYINSEPMAAKVSHDDFHNLDAVTDSVKGISSRFAAQLAPDTPERIQQEREKFDAFFEGSGRFRWPWQIAEWIKPEDAQQYPMLSALASYGGWGLETALKGLSGFGHMVPAAFKDAMVQEGVPEDDANRYANTLGGFIEWKMTDFASHGMAPHATEAPFGGRSHIYPHTEYWFPKRVVPEEFLPELEKIATAVEAARPWIENGQPIPRGVHDYWNDAIKEQSKTDLKSLDQALQTANKSKTRERSPELFGNLVKQIVGDGKIEIDAEAVRKLYGEDFPEPDDGKLGWIPELRQQLETAEATGGSVEVPLADWLARVEPETAKALRDDIRVRPQGLTNNEIEAFDAKREAEAKEREEKFEPEGGSPPRDEVEGVRRVAGVQDTLFSNPLGWQEAEPSGKWPSLLPETAERGGEVIHTVGDKTVTVPRIAGMKLGDLLDKVSFDKMDEGTKAIQQFFGSRFKELVGDTPIHIVTEADITKLLSNEEGLPRQPPGYHSALHNHIVLDEDMVNGNYPPWYTSRVIMHEAEHALSSAALYKYPVLDAAVKMVMKDADLHIGSKDAKARKSFDYAFKNSHEFLADTKSRPALQKWLAQAPASPETVKVVQQIADALKLKDKVVSTWDATRVIVKDLYNKVLGRVPKDSVLDQVFKLSEILEDVNSNLEKMAKEQGVSKGDLLRAEPKPDFAEGDKPFFGKMAIGMNKRWQEKYFKLIEQRNAEDMERQFKVAEREERQRQTEQWKRDSSAMYQEVSNDFQGRPDIAIGTFFNEGRLHGVKVSDSPKLDTTKLSPEQKALLPKVTYGRGGIDPDDLAGAFGLRSGDEVVQVLAQIQAAKGDMPFRQYVDTILRKEVSRRMLGRFGDLEENIMNEAIEHVIGSTQMDILHEELVGLGMRLNRELPFTKEDTKSFAKSKFDTTPVGQITVEKMLRDAGKAGTDAELALLDNKPDEAFQAKQKQYLSMRMAEEAKKFEKEQRRFEKLAKQFSAREVKSVLPEYTNYIHQILTQIGRPVRRSIQDLQAALARDGYGGLEQFVQAKENALREMPVAEFLYNSNYKKQTADMTVGEYRAVMNSIKTLVHNGRDEMSIEVEGAKRDLEDVLSEMKGKLDDLGKDKAPRIDRELNPAIRTIRTYWASSLTTESLLNRWDKDDPRGIFNRYIVYPLAEAANHEAKLIREYQVTLREAAGDISDIDKKITNDLFVDPLTGDHFDMRKRNALGILQNVGNRSNLEKLAKGFGLEPWQVINWLFQKTRENILTDGDWNRALRIGKVFAKLSDMADTMAENVSGVTYEKIPLESIQTPFGMSEGWYNPIKYDPNRPGRSKRLIGPNALEEEGYFRATTPQGYTKGRTGYIAPVELNLDVVPMRIKQMIHDIAFRPAVLQTSKVFYDSEFQRSVIKNYGEVYAKQLVPFLKDVANYSNNMGGSDAAGVANRAIEFFRQNLIATLVGFNPHTVMKHGMTAAVNSLTEVGPVNFMRELSGLMMNSEVAGKNNWQFAMEHSEELQRRMRNWSELIQGQPEMSLMSASPRQMLISAGSTPIAVGDLLSAVPTWLARYRTAIEEGIDHGQAVAEGNRAVRRAHGSSAITNRAQIMRSNALGATFSSLYGFFSHMLNKQFELAWKAADSFQGLKAGDLSAAKQHTPALVMGLVSYVIFPAVVEELVTPYTNSERDSWGMKAAKTMAKGISSSFIGARDFVDGFINTREGGAGLIPTAFKSIYDISRDLGKGKKVMNKEEAGRAIKHTFTAVGTLSGLTNAQEGRTAEFLYRYHQGLEHPRGFMDWSRGLTRGTLKEYRR